MNSLAVKYDAHARMVSVDDEALHILLADGRELSAPLSWFPVLERATPAQRANWRLIGHGEGVHWPEIDEDVSVTALLGHAS
jgi:hypothetical protein